MNYRNHQLYLAERTIWLDTHIEKTSKRALMKIRSLNEGSEENIKALQNLVYTSLLNKVSNSTILVREGFYLMNLAN
jgi:hypothetical protein